MVKNMHSITGLVFILLGGLLLASNIWFVRYWLPTYLVGNSHLVVAGALMGFGVREILLEFNTEKHTTTKERQ